MQPASRTFHPQTRIPTLGLDRVNQLLGRAASPFLPTLNLAPGQSSFQVEPLLGLELSAEATGTLGAYGELNGARALREQICAHYASRYHHTLSPEQVCITNGASEGIALILSLLLRPGMELLMGASCYPAYRPLHLLFRGQRREVPMRPDFNLDVAAIPALLTPTSGALLVNSPSNPFGTILSPQDLEALAELPIPVIFDEVYQALPLQAGRQVPSAVALTDRHFVVGSFSKSVAAPGLRVGYVISPPHLADELVNIKALLSVCTSPSAQAMASILLRHWDRVVTAHQRMLQQHWQHFSGLCTRLRLPLLVEPQAGFFATLRLPTELPPHTRRALHAGQSSSSSCTRAQQPLSLELALMLAEEYALGVVPGTDFQDQGEDFIRLNFSVPYVQLEPALQRLRSVLDGNPLEIPGIQAVWPLRTHAHPALEARHDWA